MLKKLFPLKVSIFSRPFVISLLVLGTFVVLFFAAFGEDTREASIAKKLKEVEVQGQVRAVDSLNSTLTVFVTKAKRLKGIKQTEIQVNVAADAKIVVAKKKGDLGSIKVGDLVNLKLFRKGDKFFSSKIIVKAAKASPTPTPTLGASPTPAQTPLPTPTSVPPTDSLKDPSFEVTSESGTRLANASVSYVLKLSDGRFRMYYCGMGGILSAISSDGLTFTSETGTRISSGTKGESESVVCDPTAVALPDGRFRMYYKGGTSGEGPGKSTQRIFSAISGDGLSFKKEGLAIESTAEHNGFASVPEAILLPDGRVRVYFVSDGSYVGHGVVSAITSDGLSFSSETTKVVAFVDPSIAMLPDGRFMLVAPAIPVLPKGITASVPVGIYALVSKDGITFGNPVTILADGKIWIDPTVVRISENTWRVYYWSPNEQPSQIHSLTIRLK